MALKWPDAFWVACGQAGGTSSNGAGMAILGALHSLSACSHLKALSNGKTLNTHLERASESEKHPRAKPARGSGGKAYREEDMKEGILRDASEELYEARSGSLAVLQAVTEVLCLRCLCQVLFCGSPDCPPAVSTASWRRDTTGQNTRLLPSPPSSSPRCSTRPTAAPQPPSACSTPGSAPRERPLALRGEPPTLPGSSRQAPPHHLRRSRPRPGALRAPPRRSGPAAAARPALPGRGWRRALRTRWRRGRDAPQASAARRPPAARLARRPRPAAGASSERPRERGGGCRRPLCAASSFMRQLLPPSGSVRLPFARVVRTQR